MKNLLPAIVALAFLASCSQANSEGQDAAAEEVDANIQEAVEAAPAEEAAPMEEAAPAEETHEHVEGEEHAH